MFSNLIDDAVTGWLQRLWYRSLLLDASMVVIGKWTPITMLAVIALSTTGYGISPSHDFVHGGAPAQAAFAAVISAIIGRALNEPISRWVDRARPFETDGFQPLLAHDAGQAFPSNHATGAFALAVSMMHVPDYFGVLLVLAILLCVARIYNGLHHVTDVVAGVLHGSLVACVVLWGGSFLG